MNNVGERGGDRVAPVAHPNPREEGLCYSFLSWSIIVGAARRESSETMPNDCLRTR
jgi:hypothetical protein